MPSPCDFRESIFHFICTAAYDDDSHLEIFPNPAALMQRYSSKDPKLIFAVPSSLSHGPSRALFSEFAETPDNVVLLTGRGEEGTLGRILFERWNSSQRDDTKWDRGKIGNNVMMDGNLRLKVQLIHRHAKKVSHSTFFIDQL